MLEKLKQKRLELLEEKINNKVCQIYIYVTNRETNIKGVYGGYVKISNNELLVIRKLEKYCEEKDERVEIINAENNNYLITIDKRRKHIKTLKKYIDYKYASKIYNEILTNSKTTNGIEYYYKPKYINSNILKYLKEMVKKDNDEIELLNIDNELYLVYKLIEIKEYDVENTLQLSNN